MTRIGLHGPRRRGARAFFGPGPYGYVRYGFLLDIGYPKGTPKSFGWWSLSLSTWFKMAITGRDPHFRTHAFATWCTDTTAVALKDRESNSESVFKRIHISTLTGGLPQFHGQWICSSRLCRPSIWSKWCHTQLLRPWKERERERGDCGVSGKHFFSQVENGSSEGISYNYIL